MSAWDDDEFGLDLIADGLPRPAPEDTEPGLPLADLTRGIFHAELDAIDLIERGLPEMELRACLWVGDPLLPRRSFIAKGLGLGLVLAPIGGKCDVSEGGVTVRLAFPVSIPASQASGLYGGDTCIF